MLITELSIFTRTRQSEVLYVLSAQSRKGGLPYCSPDCKYFFDYSETGRTYSAAQRRTLHMLCHHPQASS